MMSFHLTFCYKPITSFRHNDLSNKYNVTLLAILARDTHITIIGDHTASTHKTWLPHTHTSTIIPQKPRIQTTYVNIQCISSGIGTLLMCMWMVCKISEEPGNHKLALTMYVKQSYAQLKERDKQESKAYLRYLPHILQYVFRYC